MTPTRSRRLARAAAPAAALLALTACLAGCRGATVIATSSSAATTAGTDNATGTAAGAAGTAVAQDDGTAASQPAAGAAQGSVTVSISSPVKDSGTVAVPVSCVTGPGYRAAVTSAVVQGDQISYTAEIPRYTGPGSYYAVVAVTLRQASGVVTTVGGISRVPANITTSGGSFAVSAVGSGGRTFTGSLSWTCGS
jgi:hypothetical protein